MQLKAIARARIRTVAWGIFLRNSFPLLDPPRQIPRVQVVELH